ncbi:VOC family protein [Cellulomonas aerilata]|uniref:Glyoxalase n=1 Tax=Cellulomonas aerilata TaxID=515326 RepID=A0A512D8B3_9CELL|nr:VOC family protein [Cellulomonas aerilata]GEO32647.1 glyoxalase [Cellulomonas aerilata]
MDTSTTRRTHITALHAVLVRVTDVDRALEFYVGTLGFEVRMDVTFGGGGGGGGGALRWVEVAPAGGATTVGLAAPEDGSPAGVDTGIRLASLDVAADHATLRAAGADADDVLDIPGTPPMFVVRDPDGNRMVVVGGV